MDENKNVNKFFILAISLVIADQISKLLVKGFNLFGISHEGMHIGQSFSVIGEFLRITYVENPGMAFGIGFGSGKIFLSLFSVAASIGLVWFLSKLKQHNFWVKLGISLILAGAVGNLIDRVFYGVFYGENPLFYGHVVDFIQVDIPDISILGRTYSYWPVFNIADACVSVGVVTLIFAHKHIPSLSELNRKKDAPDNEVEKISDDNPLESPGKSKTEF